MNRKEIIFNLYHKNYSYGEIGRILDLSRQRVHQIVKNYTTYTYRSKKILLKMSNGCELCGEKASIIHHIDGNSHNNSEHNKMALCKKCHRDIHLSKESKKIKDFKTKRQRYHENKCIICNKDNYYARGLCKNCYKKWWSLRNKEENID